MRAHAALLSTLVVGSLACESFSAPRLREGGDALNRLGTEIEFSASPNAATVLMDLAAGGCGLFDGDGNLAFGTSKLNVVTHSANGNALHKCQLDVPNSTGRAAHYDSDDNPFGPGIPCFIADGTGGGFITLDWRETVSASGRATLTCHAG